MVQRRNAARPLFSVFSQSVPLPDTLCVRMQLRARHGVVRTHRMPLVEICCKHIEILAFRDFITTWHCRCYDMSLQIVCCRARNFRERLTPFQWRSGDVAATDTTLSRRTVCHAEEGTMDCETIVVNYTHPDRDAEALSTALELAYRHESELLLLPQ